MLPECSLLTDCLDFKWLLFLITYIEFIYLFILNPTCFYAFLS